MIQIIKNKLTILAVLLIIAGTASAQIPDEIVLSLKTGNASTLAKYFSQNVELVVLDTENMYSKAHAQQVMSDFFKKYPPKGFSIIHQGGKDDSNYMIGNLIVKDNRFRVYFLVKSKSGAAQIHQLRIEKQTQ